MKLSSIKKGMVVTDTDSCLCSGKNKMRVPCEIHK